MPPAKRQITPPAGGWKEDHAYLVEVAWKPTNPIHRAILHVGFLDKQTNAFGGYCEVWCNSYEDMPSASHAHYLKVVRELGKIGA